MKEKFQVGDWVRVCYGMSTVAVPAEVVQVGNNEMRRVRFSDGASQWVPVGSLSGHNPKFKVGDEVRSSVGGFPVTSTAVEAVDLLSSGVYRYTIGGAYFMEDKLRLSEYKFKVGDGVLVKGTLQPGTVVGRKLFTGGMQEYTVEFPDGKCDYIYAEELVKAVGLSEEAPHRLQAAVDAVDVQIAGLQKQVEAAQAKRILLSQTRTVLLDMIREDEVGS